MAMMVGAAQRSSPPRDGAAAQRGGKGVRQRARISCANMAGARDAPDRRPLERRRLRRAERLGEQAWRDLPVAHRRLLSSIGAEQRSVVDRPLGAYVDELLISAGHPGLLDRSRADLDRAIGAWIDRLRLVAIDAGHPALAGLDDRSYEAMIARAFWHEWGHALSLARATADDVAAGPQLLNLTPTGISEYIRGEGYRQRQYTHELIAEIYALLMARRRRGEVGQPPWLDDRIYELMRRVCGWNE